MRTQTAWTIGELAAHAGLSVKTVRYYCDIGLLPVAERSAGGHRRFGPDALERLHLIRRLRALELPIATITEAVTGQRSLAEVVDSELSRTQERLAELRWRQATLRALDTSDDELRLHRLATLSRVQQLPRAYEDLVRSWERAIPDYVPKRLAGLIMAQAVPDPLPDSTPEVVLAFAELHTLVSHPAFVWNMFAPPTVDVAYLYAGLNDVYDLAFEAQANESGEQLHEALGLLIQLSARATGVDDSPGFRRYLRHSVDARPLVRAYWEAVSAVTGDCGRNVGAAHHRMIDALPRPGRTD
jgi:DNA-binding transcriptional MerR regulator